LSVWGTLSHSSKISLFLNHSKTLGRIASFHLLFPSNDKPFFICFLFLSFFLTYAASNGRGGELLYPFFLRARYTIPLLRNKPAHTPHPQSTNTTLHIASHHPPRVSHHPVKGFFIISVSHSLQLIASPLHLN